ncbi:MAG: tRNA (guanosine(46)-N7)-methyltransferase TrmB [Treponema sp.]|jgi:tRNA (guanine-N7-)-methyltransferase|nr:tRNA (guanosine(46)-N7)-methyltransferase TrmB [Treponema sp.]
MIKSYVKRLGRFTDAQKEAYNSLAKDFIIPFSEGYLNLPEIFSNNNESVTMEIGFGSGYATAEIAQSNPDKNYLGIEVHRPGIGRLLWEIKKRSLKNIRIIECDAALVCQKIEAGSLDVIHVFFPDPWPKKRHHKRRLIQRPFTNTLANCLKPQGYLYMVTDWEDYALHALNELNATALLANAFEGFAQPQTWRPKTRFEEKGKIQGHAIWELMFRKN